MDNENTLQRASNEPLPSIPKLTLWLAGDNSGSHPPHVFDFVNCQEEHRRFVTMAHKRHLGNPNGNVSSDRHGLSVPHYRKTLQNDLMYDLYEDVIHEFDHHQNADSLQSALDRRYRISGPFMVWHMTSLREQTARRLFAHVLNTKLGSENTNTRMFQTLLGHNRLYRATGIRNSEYWLYNHVFEKIYISAARTWRLLLTESLNGHYIQFLNAGAERISTSEHRARTAQALQEGWV